MRSSAKKAAAEEKIDSRQIRVSHAVYEQLRKLAEAFETMDAVLRKLLDLPPKQ